VVNHPRTLGAEIRMHCWESSTRKGRARPLEKDHRSAAKAAGLERTLRIGNALGRVFPCHAQLDLRGCDHVAEQFEPFGTF
jgi:hypothetical protein